MSSTIIGSSLGLATTILLSRIFGPQNFGIFKTLTAIYGLAINFLDFGFQNTLIKYISEFATKKQEEKINHLIQNLFLFRLIILVIIIPLSIIFREQIVIIFMKDKALSFLIYPIVIFTAIAFLDLTRPIIMGLQNFRLIALTNIITPFFTLLIVIPLSFFFGLPLAIIGLGVANLTGSFICIIYLYNKKVHKKTKKTILVWPKLIFSYGLPSYLSSMPSYAFLLIFPLISLFFNQTKVGYFALSFSFYTMMMIIPGIIGQVLFPRISSLAVRGITRAENMLKKILSFYVLLIVVEIALGYLFTKSLINIFVPQFLPAVPLAITMIVTGAILGTIVILISYFTALHKLRIAFGLNLSLTVLFILVSLMAMRIVF